MTDITTRLLSMSEAMYMDRDQDELDALLLEAKAEIERLRAALERQADNMAFIINHHTMHDSWYEKFSRELEEDRAALIPSEQKGDADGK